MLTYRDIVFNIYLRFLLYFEHHDSFLITVKWTVLANQRDDQCLANQGNFFQITRDQHQCHLDWFGQSGRVFSSAVRPGSGRHVFHSPPLCNRLVNSSNVVGRCEEPRVLWSDVLYCRNRFSSQMKCPRCNSELKLKQCRYISWSRQALPWQMCIRYVFRVILGYVRLRFHWKG